MDAYRYRAVKDWAKWRAGQFYFEVAAVATDSRDRVYVFNRGDLPVSIFDRDGNFLTGWGENEFVRAHGIVIGPDDSVYCTDDLGHTVKKFSPDGKLLMTLGVRGVPSDTGATSIDYRTIKYAGPPFHFPTNVVLAENGDLFISDGYGNARIHHFTPDGRLVKSWGLPGSGPGQFHVPHGIAMDRHGTIYVADRENSRLQMFSQEGDFLGEWTEIARPCEVAIAPNGHVFVAELGYRAGMWPGTIAPHADSPGGRVSIFDEKGTLLSRWGGGLSPTEAGDFYAPHDIWIDSRGDLYVAEVVRSAAGNKEPQVDSFHTLQKFERI